ncbi:MAG TPA: SPASM domain-containing protein, partial [Thermodesulfovibrionales bacterium]|nr:SPASM domain-containing protein [Thermodesulfovibrionales bacterium]
ENIRGCTDLQKSYGRNKVRFMLNFVILEQNIHEIPAFVSLAAQLGVEHVTYSYCTDTATGRLKTFGAEVLYELFYEAREEGKKLHIKVDTPPLYRNQREICFFMERAVALLPGEIFPCHAMAPGYKTKTRYRSFGDVRSTPLLDIWKRPDYQEFRRRVLRGNFPAECLDCECKEYLVP